MRFPYSSPQVLEPAKLQLLDRALAPVEFHRDLANALLLYEPKLQHTPLIRGQVANQLEESSRILRLVEPRAAGRIGTGRPIRETCARSDPQSRLPPFCTARLRTIHRATRNAGCWRAPGETLPASDPAFRRDRGHDAGCRRRSGRSAIRRVRRSASDRAVRTRRECVHPVPWIAASSVGITLQWPKRYGAGAEFLSHGAHHNKNHGDHGHRHQHPDWSKQQTRGEGDENREERIYSCFAGRARRQHESINNLNDQPSPPTYSSGTRSLVAAYLTEARARAR